jgi:hypothetical protein
MQKRQQSLESQLVGWFSLHLVFDFFLEIVDEFLQAKTCKSRGQHFIGTSWGYRETPTLITFERGARRFRGDTMANLLHTLMDLTNHLVEDRTSQELEARSN